MYERLVPDSHVMFPELSFFTYLTYGAAPDVVVFSLATMAAMSVAGMCLAESTRKPSTPSAICLLRKAARPERTLSAPVLRSGRPSSSQFWTWVRSEWSWMVRSEVGQSAEVW